VPTTDDAREAGPGRGGLGAGPSTVRQRRLLRRRLDGLGCGVELLYRVSSNDSVEGSVEREVAHRSAVLHRSGIVFLVRPDRCVLLSHRSRSKAIFGDRYDASAAFHVTFGESYAEAAVRELKEEVGVSAAVTFLGKFEHHDPPEHQIVGVFSSHSDAPIVLDPTESAGYEFRSRSEVDQLLRTGSVTPWLRDGWPIARDRL